MIVDATFELRERERGLSYKYILSIIDRIKIKSIAFDRYIMQTLFVSFRFFISCCLEKKIFPIVFSRKHFVLLYDFFSFRMYNCVFVMHHRSHPFFLHFAIHSFLSFTHTYTLALFLSLFLSFFSRLRFSFFVFRIS